VLGGKGVSGKGVEGLGLLGAGRAVAAGGGKAVAGGRAAATAASGGTRGVENAAVQALIRERDAAAAAARAAYTQVPSSAAFWLSRGPRGCLDWFGLLGVLGVLGR
jgi:hypothetical protein